MNTIKKKFPQGKSKAFTLSYDDGVIQDKKLLKIFNENKLKCTFNLNSGLHNDNGNFFINGLEIKRLKKDEIKEIYKGHEISLHGLNHLSLTEVNKETLYKEILEDRNNHERIFGKNIIGMAYPNGVYNSDVIEELKKIGVIYSRTVKSHNKFMLPNNYLEWHPTAHHNDKKLVDLAKEFVMDSEENLKLFYVWGHSYEFDLDNNWHNIEKFCQYISRRDDIWYCTNGEIINYLKALDNVIISEDEKFIFNPSNIDTWIKYNEKLIHIKRGERIDII